MAIPISRKNLSGCLKFYTFRTVGLFCFAFLLYLPACQDRKATEKEIPMSKDSLSNSTGSDTTRQIIFFGNSITAGYGLNPSDCFTNLIQKRIDSLKLPYRTVNAGLSGETSAGGVSRI